MKHRIKSRQVDEHNQLYEEQEQKPRQRQGRKKGAATRRTRRGRTTH